MKNQKFFLYLVRIIPYLVGFFLPLVIWSGLAVAISHEPFGLPWDLWIIEKIHTSTPPELDYWAATVTNLGTYEGVIPLTIILALVLIWQKRWQQSIYLLITILGIEAISFTSKALIHRERPHLWESSYYLLPRDYSFPSGHAMLSMGFFLAILMLTWGNKWRWLVLLLGSLFVTAIAWTRLYLGVHFPSDIVGGWLLALAWAMIMALLLKILKILPSLGDFLIIQGEEDIY